MALGMMSKSAVFFSVEPSRGKKVIDSLMEDFDGILVSDRYAGYNYFPSDKRQICWAHLKRDFTKLSEKQDKPIARIGSELLNCQADLFELWHHYKLGGFSRWELIRKIQFIRHKVGELLEQGLIQTPN